MTNSGPEPDEDATLEDLMAGFRRTSGGATARFGAAQASIIRDLVGQVVELIGGDALEAGRMLARRTAGLACRTTSRR